MSAVEWKLSGQRGLGGTLRLSCVVHPTNPAMQAWFEAATALTEQHCRMLEEIQLERCPVCSSYWWKTPMTVRANKRFCSNTCRARDQRHRRHWALQLHSEGHSIEEISTITSSRPEAVKRWLATKVHPTGE